MRKWTKISLIILTVLLLGACANSGARKEDSPYKVTAYDYDSNYYYHEEYGYNLNISF